MNYWLNSWNILIIFTILLIINNNKQLLVFILWAEILWICLFLITILYGSWNSSLILIHSFYILICTAVEISLLSLIFINIYFKK